ncbi:MAG: flippase-like domain-containing protein, partial [Candidatus Marinimicrobia bacterium]|nr:flippase-like domain-containing protein [Candidatus Neomarinimicrobiota bacterium]
MNKYLKLSVAIGISLAGLYFAFRGVEFEELLGAITRVNGSYILASVLLMVFSVVLRALRWRLILEPIQNISFHPLFGATMIGYFGNSVLPFRLGELLRAYSLSRTKPISASEAFGTIVLERVLDMIGVLVVMVFFFVLYPFPPWLKLSGLVAGFGTGILILVLIGLALAQSEIKNKIFSWKIFQNPIGQKFRKVLENLV